MFYIDICRGRPKDSSGRSSGWQKGTAQLHELWEDVWAAKIIEFSPKFSQRCPKKIVETRGRAVLAWDAPGPYANVLDMVGWLSQSWSSSFLKSSPSNEQTEDEDTSHSYLFICLLFAICLHASFPLHSVMVPAPILRFCWRHYFVVLLLFFAYSPFSWAMNIFIFSCDPFGVLAACDWLRLLISPALSWQLCVKLSAAASTFSEVSCVGPCYLIGFCDLEDEHQMAGKAIQWMWNMICWNLFVFLFLIIMNNRCLLSSTIRSIVSKAILLRGSYIYFLLLPLKKSHCPEIFRLSAIPFGFFLALQIHFHLTLDVCFVCLESSCLSESSTCVCPLSCWLLATPLRPSDP